MMAQILKNTTSSVVMDIHIGDAWRKMTEESAFCCYSRIQNV